MKKLLMLISATILSTYLIASPTILEVKYKNIEVNGKPSQVYTIEQPNGTWGYYGYKGESFDVIVKNELNEPTVIHWHGILLPNNQDGVPLTQKLIAPHSEYHYNFVLKNSGTYWMHSHAGLQEQKLAEAPLIVYDDKTENSSNNIVLFLQDFSFKSPDAILEGLTHGKPDTESMLANNSMMMGMKSGESMAMSGSHHKMKPDLNDVTYDAYLVNYKNLNDPEIKFVKPGSTIRLRFIDGSAMTNYWVNLGKLKGTLIAVDGSNIKPITGSKFQIGMGNRLDIMVTIPKEIGYFPILAQVEGTKFQTGIIITNSKSVKIPKISSEAKTALPGLNYDQEMKLSPFDSKEIKVESVNQEVKLVLSGNMKNYVWAINGQIWPHVIPIKVGMGNEVQIDIINKSMMAHPIHLHGYKFKVVEINGKKVDGALHDTILVQPMTEVKVIFLVDNPGNWYLHCHSLYHMARGMMTYISTTQSESDSLTK